MLKNLLRAAMAQLIFFKRKEIVNYGCLKGFHSQIANPVSDYKYTAPCDGCAWAFGTVSAQSAFFNFHNESVGYRACNHVYNIGYNSDILIPVKKGDTVFVNFQGMNVQFINFYKTNAED